MDRLDELSAFLGILDAGSLAAAGRRLGRSPPAMTRLLTTLEERVGARLIERSTRRLAPTEAGRRLAEQARRLLAGYDEAVSALAGDALRGTLRVTAPLVFGRRHVSPVIASFLEAFPGLRVELTLNDRNLDMIEEELDVAVRIGALADASLVARRVGEVRRVLVASPHYLARRGAPQKPSDLAAHDLVLTASRPTALEWRFRGAARDEVIRPEARLVVNDIDAMVSALKVGFGIGRALSYQVVEDLAAGALVRLMPDFEPPAAPVHLVVASNQLMAAKTRAFLDHAAPRLARLAVLRGL